MKKCLSLAITLCIAFALQAQISPYSWNYSAKKTSENTYELHFHVDLNSPWHTYSQFTPDGGPVPTHFSFAKNPLVFPGREGERKRQSRSKTRGCFRGGRKIF